MFKWTLERPLIVFDIEATGVNPRTDRVVEIALIKLLPSGERTTHTFRINPGGPIPAEATRVHGITDRDVADCPRFEQVAQEVLALLSGCDLAGFNVLRFDIPMLAEEFRRAGLPFDPDALRVIDAQRIFHRREPRDLTAALAFYCGEMHLGAHGAAADATATLRVIEGQFQRYADIPRDVGALSEYCTLRKPDWADRSGKLRWQSGQIVLNFGRKKGAALRELIRDDPGFAKWMLRSDFPLDTRDIVEKALRGEWPQPPAVVSEEDPTPDSL